MAEESAKTVASAATATPSFGAGWKKKIVRAKPAHIW